MENINRPELPHTLDEVLVQLKKIVEHAETHNKRFGLFAFVYYLTTLEIKKRIIAGDFEDSDRMIRFDVEFANLYLKAYYDYLESGRVNPAWQIAFEVEQKSLTVLQHVMLGMNAHINFDLGIAATNVMNAQDINLLKPDFMHVNSILASLVNDLQSRIGKVSPLLFLLDWVGGRKDEQFIDFSMVRARQYAWQLAQDLSRIDGVEYQKRLASAEFLVTQLSQAIIKPPGKILGFTLRCIQYFENKNTSKIITALKT